MTDCYWCARDLRRGHHGGCPVLEMTPARRMAFFGPVLAEGHAPLGPLAKLPPLELDADFVKSAKMGRSATAAYGPSLAGSPHIALGGE